MRDWTPLGVTPVSSSCCAGSWRASYIAATDLVPLRKAGCVVTFVYARHSARSPGHRVNFEILRSGHRSLLSLPVVLTC